jgi:hypothetical protein
LSPSLPSSLPSSLFSIQLRMASLLLLLSSNHFFCRL